MAFSSWVNRISSLPEVLAGPILRRVDPDGVTVWVATQNPLTVTLRVFNSSGTEVMRGNSAPLKLGRNMHAVAVTASPLPPLAALVPGEIFTYNLYFRNGSGDAAVTDPDLKAAGILRSAAGIGPQSLGYAPLTLPSFSLPPVDLNQVRIIHGSCRKPHAPGRDALRALNGIISASVSDANHRPHQLFLTGDQIYADDVADGLLFMLIDAANALMAPTETPPGGPPPGPGARSDYVRGAGITTDAPDARSHLVTFAEYCMMYVFAWSEVLWQADFPTFTEATGIPVIVTARAGNQGLVNAYNEQIRSAQAFQRAVADVRRALANVPTYMILDDHEVTDDFLFDRHWVNNLFPHNASDAKEVQRANLFTRIIQNAVAAYAVFQGWGNDPAQFSGSNNGAQAIAAISAWVQSPNSNNDASLRKFLGLPLGTVGALGSGDNYPRDSSAVRWHFLVKAPSYQVLMMDNRTRRGYPPPGDGNHPQLLSNPAFDEQFSLLQPLPSDQVTLVVAPSPPVGYPLVDHLQNLKQTPAWLLEKDVEIWSGQTSTFETLFARLAALPNATGGTRQARVILLSGDVHFGFAFRLRYRATKPFNQATVPTEAAFAQFTSSAFKNQSGLTLKLHEHGFLAKVAGFSPITRYGWANPGGGTFTVGTDALATPGAPPIIVPVPVTGTPAVLEVPTLFIPSFPSQAPAPDWRYRIEFLISSDVRTGIASPPPKVVTTFPPPGDRNAALTAYLDSLNDHNGYRGQYGSGKELVGQNNLGEISFQWGSDENSRIAIQELWWWLGNRPDPFPLSRFSCSLGLATTEPI